MVSSFNRNGLALGLALMVVSGMSVRPATVDAATPDNQLIATNVVRLLQGGPSISLEHVEVIKSIVVLHGEVPTLWARERAARIAETAPEVRGVVNLLVVNRVARSDDLIAEDVRNALQQCGPARVQLVNVFEGKVILQGEVGSVGQQQCIETAVRQVNGVVAIDDRTVPRQLEETNQMAAVRASRPDSEIRKAVVEALQLNPRVPKPGPGVQVTNGIVTLTGTVANLNAKKASVETARNTVGVRGLRDFVNVPGTGEALEPIVKKALRDDPALKNAHIIVTLVGDTVHLSGVVDSRAQALRAIQTVAKATGVRFIENDLAVDLTVLQVRH